MKSILIIGFGRMGLSHSSILKGIDPNLNIDIYDPNKMLTFAGNFTKKFHKFNFLNKFPKKLDRYEIIMILTPPNIHKQNLQQLNGYEGKIFVEKPGLFNEADIAKINKNKTLVGYVLNHHPFIKKIKALLQQYSSQEFSKLNISLETNIDFSAKSNWRSDISSGGGILNEFGSHCLSIFTFLIDDYFKYDFNVEISNANEIRLRSDNVTICLFGDSKNVRKASYMIDYESSNLNVRSDLYKLSFSDNDVSNEIYMNESHFEVPYYLRGIEFTNQMIHLLECDKFDSVDQSMFIDAILNNNER